jgi:hypothetical protein
MAQRPPAPPQNATGQGNAPDISNIFCTDSNAQAWLWKRYLKMAARAGGLEGYQTLRQAVGLTAGRKRLLAAYWAVWRVLAQLERR